MLLNTNTNHKAHERSNIKRFGEMLGIKQDALAIELNRACPETGEGTWYQQKISLLEQKETIDTPRMQKISTALKIPVESIQNFDEEQTVNIIANTFNDNSMLNAINHNPTFHPIDKLIQLYEEKIGLDERMLQE